jgi:hypothetical protein
MNVDQSEGLQRLEFDDPAAGIIAYTIGGKITAEQAAEVFSEIDAAHAEGRKLRIFYEMHGFPTAAPSVFVEKFKHLGTILKTVERMAIVGDQRWLGVYTKIMDPITKPKMRHFTIDERAAAVEWIRE